MATSKNNAEVLIGGKVFTLSGFESDDYLQQVSLYLNQKIAECTGNSDYRKLSADNRGLLLALNVADDYFKAKNMGVAVEQDLEQKDRELYELKHELVSSQMKVEEVEEMLSEMQRENHELQKQIVKLETKIEKI